MSSHLTPQGKSHRVLRLLPGWGITDAGRDALDTLNAGQSVWIGAPEPTVRVFARPADNTSCEAA